VNLRSDFRKIFLSPLKNSENGLEMNPTLKGMTKDDRAKEKAHALCSRENIILTSNFYSLMGKGTNPTGITEWTILQGWWK